MTDTNALAQRYFEEAWNQGDMAVVDELFAPDCAYYLNSDVVLQGAERMKQAILGTRAMFSALRFTVEEQVVDGDRIAARLTYGGTYLGGGALVPDTAIGRHIALLRGLILFHLKDGKVVEAWHSSDRLSHFQQLDLKLTPVSAS